MLKNYWLITKPGIIFGNLISAAGGFFLASRGQVDLRLFLTMAAGVALVIASGCVFNNYIDRDIDRVMDRTRGRVLVTGGILPVIALVYATALGVVGLWLLYAWTTPLAAAFAVGGLFVYVCLYSLCFKRRSVWGTFVGSFSGAVPPVIGYCAVTGRADVAVLILFVMFSLWQMPHSYAIAIFRQKDYRTAGIPVLPVARGTRLAKWHIIAYIALFTLASSSLTACKYAGYGYLGVAVVMSLIWLVLGFKGLATRDDRLWARRLFMFSILIVVALSAMMAIDY